MINPKIPRLASVRFTVRTKLAGYAAGIVATTRSKIL